MYSYVFPFQLVDSSVDAPLSSASIHRLAHEILFMIFQQIALEDTEDEESNRSRELAYLSSVCKYWNKVVEPLLYESVGPKSQRSLLNLQRTLCKRVELRRHVRKISSPVFKGSFGGNQANWRARPIYNTTRGVMYMMSVYDYHSMVDLFRELADICPNLTGVSVPYRTQENDLSIGTVASGLSIPNPLRLRSLTLTRLIFSHEWPLSSASKALSHIILPELTEFVVYDFVQSFIPAFLERVSTPRLKVLKMLWGSCRLEDLQTFVLSVKSTLRTIHFDGRIDAPVGDQLIDWPWYQDLSNPEDQLSSIRHLTIRVSRRLTNHDGFQLLKLSSLKTLELIAFSRRSPFVELKSTAPSVEEVKISCTFAYPARAFFYMFRALSRLLATKDHRMPSLKRITIRWKMDRVIGERELWKIMVFCLAHVCKTHHVVLDAQVQLVAPHEQDAWQEVDLWAWRGPGIVPVVDRALTRIERYDIAKRIGLF